MSLRPHHPASAGPLSVKTDGLPLMRLPNLAGPRFGSVSAALRVRYRFVNPSKRQ